MRTRFGLVAAIGACIGAAGCGYPSFEFGPAGAGGAGATSSSQAVSSSSGAAVSSTSSVGPGSTGSSSGTGSTGSSSAGSGGGSTGSSSASAGTGGVAPCTIGHMVISEVRTRGPGGATDEFVTLYNPTDTDIQLDAGWTLETLGLSAFPSFSYTKRWAGKGATLPAHHRFLIVGPGYTQEPEGDDTLGGSISDADSLVLFSGGAPVDAICYYFDTTTAWEFSDAVYTCAGSPVFNPHDDTDHTDVDTSLARRPGGAAGSCTDTNDNAADFVIQMPSTPQDVTSPGG